MKKAVFAVGFFGVALVAGFFVGKRLYFSNVAANNADSYNTQFLQIYDALPIDTVDYVFVGTSITAGFPLNEMYSNYHVKNRGIPFNESRHVLGRIKRIAVRHPRAIFLEMGINDLLQQKSLATIRENYSEICEIILQTSPKTRIFVQSIMPVYSKQTLEAQIEEFNSWLKDYCRRIHVTYLDIFSLLYRSGGLDRALTIDGVHLNIEGYKIWKTRLDPLITL